MQNKKLNKILQYYNVVIFNNQYVWTHVAAMLMYFPTPGLKALGFSSVFALLAKAEVCALSSSTFRASFSRSAAI